MSGIPIRNYSLRDRPNSAKAKCSTCVSLSLENDNLRRQIARLTKLTQGSGHDKIAVPFSSRDNVLISEHESGTQNCEVSSVTELNSNPSLVNSSDVNKQSSTSVNVVGKSINPYHDLSRGEFRFVDTLKLDMETQYTQTFNNRTVAYYGDFPYAYNGGFHNTRPLNDNPLLKSILERLRSQFPSLKFNSAMITKYENGKQGIPFHSDDERSISPGSMISTITLGATRVLSFRSKSKVHVANFTLSHGDVMIMTRKSQDSFEHSLIQDHTVDMRISITLRQIDGSATLSAPPDTSSKPFVTVRETEPSIKGKSSPNKITHKSTVPPASVKSKSLAVYVSSSMFSKLDATKLSSAHQEAHVFHYPGGIANGINERFHSDERKRSIDANNVKTIVLMCGTNDVDLILESPRHMRNRLLSPDEFTGKAKALDNTSRSIDNLIQSLHSWAPAAKIKIINILPRESFARNKVINDINIFLSKIPSKYSFVSFISTEKNRFLFSDRSGLRKSSCFSRFGEDNVHLNSDGIFKLAKHIKYHAHH